MSGLKEGWVLARLKAHLAGTACVVALSAAAGLGFGLLAQPRMAGAQEASEFSGAAIATDPAGNGTGEAVAAFDPSDAGVGNAGHGASLLGADGQPDHFDMNERRRSAPVRSATLSSPEPAVAVPSGQPGDRNAPAVSEPPTVGNGAPGTGAATPGSQMPSAQTAASQPTVAPSTAQTPPATGHMVPAYIGELLSNQVTRFAARPEERQALVEFYTARENRPVFTAGNVLSPVGHAALQTFAKSIGEGLNPNDYSVPALAQNALDSVVAETELRIAATSIIYARHVQSGRFDPKRISEYIDPSPTVPNPAETLTQLASAADPRATFDAFAPQYDEYRLLRIQLARLLREGRGEAQAVIPAGPSLRPGERDPRVPLLRARLGIGGAPDDETYDRMLVEAVRDFQRISGETPDGIVGRNTLAALNQGAGDALSDVIANMERWRWLPHEVAPAYVMVNIPEYMGRIVVNEQTIHETRVIVGKPETQTPVMTQDMQYAVFNPAWTVPPGIIRRDMLPKLRANPYALERQGIDVVRNGRIIDPGMVDWSRGTQGYSFRQAPGDRNAMGKMKFMFPNKHAVYLHDTPNRTLFNKSVRDLSNGCVRVQEPLKFAEVLFSLGLPGDGWTEQRISRLFGSKERYLNMKQRFPVHLAYFTTFVDGAGQLVTREDIYGTNEATKTILGLGANQRIAGRNAQLVR